jgi:hypothetical protein
MTVRAVRLPCAVVLELLASYAVAALFVRLISAGDGPAPSLITVGFAVVASFALARLMQRVDVDESQLRLLGAAASIVVLYFVLHTEYAAGGAPWAFGWVRRLFTEPRDLLDAHRYVPAGCVAVCVLWVRGILRGREPVEFGDVLPSAMFGLFAVALAALAAPPVRGPDAFGAIALLYAVLALCTLALYQTADADEPVARFAARWVPAFGALTGIAIALTIAAAALDPHSLGVLAPVGRPLLFVLEIVGRWVLGPIVGGVAWLFGLIPLHAPSPHAQPTQTPLQPVAPDDNSSTPLWFKIVGFVLGGVLGVLIVLAFIAGIWLLMRRARKRGGSVVEQRRSVERDSMLGEDLAALLSGVARRFRRTHSAQSSVEVRRLYHEMLARAERDGLARPPGATPHQFAPSLDARYASDAPSAISAAFAASRYGAVAVPERAVRDLRARWHAAATLPRSGSARPSPHEPPPGR